MTNLKVITPTVRSREWLRWVRGWTRGSGHAWVLADIRNRHKSREIFCLRCGSDAVMLDPDGRAQRPPHALRHLVMEYMPDCDEAVARDVTGA